MERPDEYERAVKHWALLEADERNKNALLPDLWVFSLRQAAIEGGVSVRFQSLVTMELAVTDTMWHGHAGIDKWIGLVWTESKSDQNKIASDFASKLDQHRRPGESVESWHKDTLHLLEQYRRTTSVAYPPAIAVDTLLTRLNLSPGSYAADRVFLCREATVPAESTLLTEVNRAIASLYPLFTTYEHSELANPTFPPRRRTITGGTSSQYPAVRGPSRTLSTYNVRASVHRYILGPHQRFYDQEWCQPGGPVSQEEEVDPQAGRPDSAGKLAAQVRRTFLLRLPVSGTYCSRLYYRQGAGRRLTSHPRVAYLSARSCFPEA
jgi:hypothetical protein